MPLRLFFESPTVGELAEAVERQRGAGKLSQVPPIRPVSRDRNLPLSYAQQRLWFINQLEPDSPAYNIGFGVRLTGALTIASLEQSLKELGRRHEVLRTRIEVKQGEAVQVIEERGEVAVELFDISQMREGEREEEATQIGEQSVRRAFDLERGPMWRVWLIRMAPDHHILLLGVNHIAADGWSVACAGQGVHRII